MTDSRQYGRGAPEGAVAVAAVRSRSRAASEQFLADHGQEVEHYRNLVSDGLKAALSQMRAEIDELAGGNAVVRDLGEQASAYVDWMQWCLWDLPVFAVALKPDDEAFSKSVTACGMVYIAIRIFDDVIDQHYTYKGRHDTLLAAVSTTYPEAQKAAGLNTLAGLLLCFQGLRALADAGLTTTLHEVVRSVRGAVVGAIMEFTNLDDWTPAAYQRLVQLKNVDYGRALYAGLDPNCASPLYPFLEKYFEMAQYLNDVEDFEDDLRWGQPNLLGLHHSNGSPPAGECRAYDEAATRALPVEAERLIADRFLALADAAEELSGVEREVARYQLASSLRLADKLGLFAPPQSQPPVPAQPASRPPLFWYSELDDVVAHRGSQSVVHVNCGACGSSVRTHLFRKQGFAFQRCGECGHVYVSPRVSAEAQAEILIGADEMGFEDKYLEVQRVSAEYVCDLMRMRTAGPRLLDIGFGRGYLLHMAQVYGFEVHGVDGSPAAVERLRPQFGQRVVQRIIGRDPIPWGSLDVVVMSHVLEHILNPLETLEHVASRMNPGGLLYVVVPDIDSTHFRIFGKHWDVISPLAHLHYWSERSLTKALARSGFADIERIEQPQLRDEVSPRWVRLMRRLGGSDTSELVMTAKLGDGIGDGIGTGSHTGNGEGR